MVDNKQEVSKFLWLNGPRIIMIIVFVLSIISKLIGSDIFFTMTASFGIALNTSEIIYSSLISVEFLLIVLLVAKPMIGLLWSGILLIIYSAVVVYLNFFSSGEIYGCFGDVRSNEISFSKILQHVGLSLLLISSWWIHNENDESM